MNRDCGIRIANRSSRIATQCTANQRTRRPLRAVRCVAPGKKVSRTFCRNGPKGASHKRFLTPFSPGVTLVELLVTMVIIAIIGTALLGASRVAMEGARESRTKSTIAKLHTLLMEKYESYETRRVDIDPDIYTKADELLPDDQYKQVKYGQILADARLLGLRELMKLEMPDRWSDIILNQVPDNTPLAVAANPPAILNSLPSLTNAYRRRYYSLPPEDKDGNPLTGDKMRQYQSAECLYMIIMLATADGEARTLFSPQDIGDADGDGAPEFHDGWGNPISFIRWPAGFVGESNLMTGDPDADPDPFDPFRRGLPSPPIPRPDVGYYPKALHDYVNILNNPTVITGYRLVPLIYSPGSSGLSGLNTSQKTVMGLDPYTKDGDGHLIGAPISSDNTDYIDNIHNHAIGN